MTDFLLYILAGAGVGFAVGVTGVGGGSLMTPLLLLFGFPLHVAIGTDLLYAAITKAGGAVAHARLATVNWRLVGLLAAGSVPASLVTALALNTLFGDASAYAPVLTTALGIMLILTALSILLRGRILSSDVAAPGPLRQMVDRHAPALTVLMGLVLGVCVTLSSVGAGAFGAVILMALYPTLRAVGIVGTDIAHAVPLTLVAGLGHLALGNVDFALLGALLIGSLPAIAVGSRVSGLLPDGVIRSILATILMGLGVKFAVL
jgi:uncharacterized membrane protein YfcA